MTQLYSREEFWIPGDDPTLINTLRLTMFQLVPHYAFNRDKVLIRENSSTKHNDEITHEISTMIVMGLENTRMVYKRFLEENPWLIKGGEHDGASMSIGGDILAFSLRVTHQEPSMQYRYVTTDDCHFTVNGKPVTNPYEGSPMLLCILRHGECIDLDARTDMNIPFYNPLYLPIGNAWFRKEKGGHRLFIEPRPGISGKEILFRARDLIIQRLHVTLQRFLTGGDAKAYGEIRIQGDRNIIANILAYYLAHHPSVTFAGPRCSHLLGNDSSVYYRATDDIARVLDEVTRSIEKDLLAVV